MKPSLTAALVLPLAITACAGSTETRGDNRRVAEPAARIVGPPESCIRTNAIRETRVRNDWTIDFIMHGGQVYRNNLPNRCSGLSVEQAFSYRTTIPSLCDLEIIRPLDTIGGGLGSRGGCGLGQFTPVELLDR